MARYKPNGNSQPKSVPGITVAKSNTLSKIKSVTKRTKEMMILINLFFSFLDIILSYKLEV